MRVDSVSGDLEARVLALQNRNGTLERKQFQMDETMDKRSTLLAEMTQRNDLLQRIVDGRETLLADLQQDKEDLLCELRRLQDAAQELRGSIRVFCRVRPKRPGSANDAVDVVDVTGPQRVSLRIPGERPLHFCFDRVFSPDAGQNVIYREVAPLLGGVFEGLHLCVFAYGQTGAGKTYTLCGSRSLGSPCISDVGIQDMAIVDLLSMVEAQSRKRGVKYEMSLTGLEIYNDAVHDLLIRRSASDPPSLARVEIKMQTADGMGCNTINDDPPSPFGKLCIPGLHSHSVQSTEDANRALQLVARNRQVATTLSNEGSSRSHSVLSLNIFTRDRPGDAGALHIIDLAGSERTKRSQASGQQLEEAKSINRSLSALADVISALGNSDRAARPHVPYRNSKLTYLLQDVLGGNGCKSLMFAQVSPDAADSHETRSTLAFATQVAGVEKGQLQSHLVTETRRGGTPPCCTRACVARGRSSSNAKPKRAC
jgi:kinesin family protein C2/C3